MSCNVPVMVVLGNPPYSVSSSNKSKWITGLLETYKKDLNEKNIQPLSDDYIKFIRFGQHHVEKSGDGVLAYISNNSFLDGVIHRQMRKSLLETFDEIYIVDLHGNSRKKEVCPDGSKDENVFDIMQGVSINIFIKKSKSKKLRPIIELANVYHCDLYGRREEKYTELLNGDLVSMGFKKIDYESPYYFFIPKDFVEKDEYNKGFGIKDLFALNSSGIKTARDNLTIQNTKEKMQKIINDFASLEAKEARKRYELGKVCENETILQAQQDLKDSELDENLIQSICYRPFDMRFTYYTGKSEGFHSRPRREVMRHMLTGENYTLVATRRVTTFKNYQHIFISKSLVESAFVSNKASEWGYVFPLYLYSDHDSSRTPNFHPEAIDKFANGLKLKFVPEKTYEADTFAPLDVLDYIYAVLHSPKYREKYQEFLKIDFSKVPYPTNAQKFWRLVDLGGKLRRIHLLESDDLRTLKINYPESGDNIVDKVKYVDSKVYINATQYFGDVPEITWNFYIGGYQPAQKWLKDRKGRSLNSDDIRHYQKIINALYLTDKIMREIDETVELF
ncbi:hypothetical protein FACS189472_08280 [Alphaproteobacteria bacterium]|nr:hypothetical protein FACS189472_08280 [Alphaproteobacteria bacterium]